MLVELSVINASFEIIKTAISNGKELYELGEHLTKFSDAGREIDQKVKLAKKGSDQESDLEIFMAQEAMRVKREDLKQLMLRTRHLLWDEFLRFEGQQQKAREKLKKLEEKRKLKRTQMIMTFCAWGVGFLIVASSLVGGIKILMSMK